MAAAPLAALAAPAAAPVTAAQVVQVTICHATSSETTPFELITIASPAAQAHLGHGDVAPVGGVCPGQVTPPAPGQDVTICHRTASDTSPFEVITIPGSALPGHLAHGDVATVNGVCPGGVALPEVIVRPVVRPTVRTAVLGTVRETVQTQSFSEVVPVVRLAEREASNRTAERGTLPATGTEIGAALLVGLLLLLLGAGATAGGKVHSGGSLAGNGSWTTVDSDGATSGGSEPTLRANAPPLPLPRRTP